MRPTLTELLGAGLLAGLAGTAAITLSQTIEMQLTRRRSSDLPAKGAEKVLQVTGTTPAQRPRLNVMAHWAYGTLVGLYRAAAGAFGLHGVPASAAHLGLLYAGNSALFGTTGISDPPWRWSGKALGHDLAHHTVYVLAAGAAFDALTARRG